jgi:hypothetical protein
MNPRKILGRFGVALAMVLAATGALANGKQFFFPSPNADPNNPNALVYAGNIKDTQGRYLSDVQLFIVATDSGITLPVKNDRPGHFRTPDVHAWIESLGGKVDPEKIRIEVKKTGYVLARPAAIPRRTSGTYAVDLLLKKVD